MGTLHSTVTFAHTSGFPRDNVVNSWTFESPGDFVTSADHDAAVAVITSFYNGLMGSPGTRLSQFIGSQISRVVNPLIRTYDITGALSGAAAGSPLFTTAMENIVAPVDADSLPSEVALALSFHASYGVDAEFAPGTRPRSRDRGRIYFGPLSVGAMSFAASGRPAPAPLLIDTLLAGATYVRTYAPLDWMVWSRASASVKPVVQASVDDAFDTQRRRGERPSLRTTAP